MDEEFVDWCLVVYGVEGGNFVNVLRGYFELVSDFVYDVDVGEVMLMLFKIEKGYVSSFFVLGRVVFEDFGDDGFVLLVEFEGDVGVVVIGVVVLVLGVSLFLMLLLMFFRFWVWSNLVEGV